MYCMCKRVQLIDTWFLSSFCSHQGELSGIMWDLQQNEWQLVGSGGAVLQQHVVRCWQRWSHSSRFPGFLLIFIQICACICVCTTVNENHWLPRSRGKRSKLHLVNIVKTPAWFFFNATRCLLWMCRLPADILYVKQTVWSVSSESTEMSVIPHPCHNNTVWRDWSLLPSTSFGFWEICCNRLNLTVTAAGFCSPVERSYILSQSEEQSPAGMYCLPLYMWPLWTKTWSSLSICCGGWTYSM